MMFGVMPRSNSPVARKIAAQAALAAIEREQRGDGDAAQRMSRALRIARIEAFRARAMRRALEERAADLARRIAEMEGDRRLSCGDIQRAVAQQYRVTVLDIVSRRRMVPIIRPRQVAMYLCRHLTALSLPAIGRAFGGRDHTTVLHAVRKIEALVAEDPALAADIDDIKRRLATRMWRI